MDQIRVGSGLPSARMVVFDAQDNRLLMMETSGNLRELRLEPGFATSVLGGGYLPAAGAFRPGYPQLGRCETNGQRGAGGPR